MFTEKRLIFYRPQPKENNTETPSRSKAVSQAQEIIQSSSESVNDLREQVVPGIFKRFPVLMGVKKFIDWIKGLFGGHSGSEYSFESENSNNFTFDSSLNPGELGTTNDTKYRGPLSYQDLKARAINGENYSLDNFDDIQHNSDGSVNMDFARGVLEGTPLDIIKLQQLQRSIAPRNPRFLKTALLIARVLKERGLSGDYFQTIFVLTLSTINRESGCGKTMIVPTDSSSALGMGQFLLSSSLRELTQIPSRERAQYSDLSSSVPRRQLETNIRNWLLGSATFNVRLTSSLIMRNLRRFQSSIHDLGQHNVAEILYIAYNSGPSVVPAAVEFYERFPEINTYSSKRTATPEQAAYIQELRQKHNLTGKKLNYINKRFIEGYWFKVQNEYTKIRNKLF